MNDEQNERMLIYRLLARLLRSPVDQSVLDSLAAVSVASGSMQDPLLKAWQGLADAAITADIAELEDEFHRLFIGLGRGELLPYRSYYETGFLMEKPLAQLREDLRMLGFKRQKDNKEPEDFLASLFEVMALLVGEQQGGQRDFFERHILSWGERFFNDMRQVSEFSFYQAVADLGRAFLNAEKAEFKL